MPAIGKVKVPEENPALLGGGGAGAQRQQRALSRTVRAKQDGVARCEVQVELIENWA
ncbi:hypothetical protein SUDANB70_02644 [Streptomyces sp. enrichment culture]